MDKPRKPYRTGETASVNNISGIKGVSWHEDTQRWRARALKNGKTRHVGLFKTKEEAGQAAAEAREKHRKIANKEKT